MGRPRLARAASSGWGRTVEDVREESGGPGARSQPNPLAGGAGTDAGGPPPVARRPREPMRAPPLPLIILALAGLAFFATFVAGSLKMAAAIMVVAFLVG